MTKTGVIRCLLSVILAVYLGFALFIADDMSAREKCVGVDVVVDGDANAGRDVRAEVKRLLRGWGIPGGEKPLARINTQWIENRLRRLRFIENVEVERLPDGRLRVSVTPMIPVARVFSSGGSYYVNREGKRAKADVTYRRDVPLIFGEFDSVHPATELLPVIDYVGSDDRWRHLVSQYRVLPGSRDIILVPMIRGHVVNIGDTADLASKLSRVEAIYDKVLPLKGWEFYDTISVKWGGQVVATRRDKPLSEPAILFDQEGEAEEEDVNSMLVATETDTCAVKQPRF